MIMVFFCAFRECRSVPSAAMSSQLPVMWTDKMHGSFVESLLVIPHNKTRGLVPRNRTPRFTSGPPRRRICRPGGQAIRPSQRTRLSLSFVFVDILQEQKTDQNIHKSENGKYCPGLSDIGPGEFVLRLLQLGGGIGADPFCDLRQVDDVFHLGDNILLIIRVQAVHRDDQRV